MQQDEESKGSVGPVCREEGPIFELSSTNCANEIEAINIDNGLLGGLTPLYKRARACCFCLFCWGFACDSPCDCVLSVGM